MTDMTLVISTIAPGENAYGPYVDYKRARKVTAVLDLPEFRAFVKNEATKNGRHPVVGVVEDWFPNRNRWPRKPRMLMTPIPESEARALQRLSRT